MTALRCADVSSGWDADLAATAVSAGADVLDDRTPCILTAPPIALMCAAGNPLPWWLIGVVHGLHYPVGRIFIPILMQATSP